MRIPIIFERDDLLVVHKPAGMTVIPARGEAPEESLVALLSKERGERLWVVHRTDRETSGALVLARSAATHRLLSEAFEGRRVEKQYLAFCAGRLPPARGVVTAPLLRLSGGGCRVGTEAEGAQKATTGYRILSVWPQGATALCKVEAAPLTGRQHQMRVHMLSIGLPLVGDRRYAPAVTAALHPRLALHAASIRLPALDGQPPLTVACPMAEDLMQFEASLGSANP